ncbi:hypothetical protein [Caldinitratiruptor microaerophilus]|uniref:Uncharacterized protein n=1 Tax=Caldinitratiruptor microaerophilus TaxID=671077 RepID=A0AA35CIL8_9FIRM|nr:hypothetical protein [Caldinitratiruptor microaerophilus]BDG59777.1 hypothetical protein caldi_08670 [Caldinitratiruptor microaerophilus]
MTQPARPLPPQRAGSPPAPAPVAIPPLSARDRASISARLRRELRSVQRDLARAHHALIRRHDLDGALAVMAVVQQRLARLAQEPPAARVLATAVDRAHGHVEFAVRRAQARDVDGAVRGITLAAGALQRALDTALAQRQQAGGPEP